MSAMDPRFVWGRAVAASDLPLSAKVVAMALEHMVNAGGAGGAGVEQLMRASGLQRRAVLYGLSAMDTGGWLHKRRQGRRGRVTEWQIEAPGLFRHDEVGAVTYPASQEDVTSAESVHRRAPQWPDTVHADAPQEGVTSAESVHRRAPQWPDTVHADAPQPPIERTAVHPSLREGERESSSLSLPATERGPRNDEERYGLRMLLGLLPLAMLGVDEIDRAQVQAEILNCLRGGEVSLDELVARARTMPASGRARTSAAGVVRKTLNTPGGFSARQGQRPLASVRFVEAGDAVAERREDQVVVYCGRDGCDHGWVEQPDGKAARCPNCRPGTQRQAVTS